MDSVTAQPLVGRTETVRQVVSAVRRADSSGAVIVADWGMGKTALMRAVVRELSESVRVFNLHASEASSRVPYGSLGPLLVGSPAGEVLSLASVLRVVTARLEETDHNAGAGTGSAQGLPLLVIDAGDYLDASSTVVIEQLIAVRKVKVLMASRDGATTGGLSMAEGLLTRHYLNPLNFAEVHELCEQMLGGTVAGGTSAALTQISGGNPRLLLALISQARRIGQLESSNAVWLLSGDSVPFDRTLADLIQSELATLSEDVRELLEVVAIAEPLPLSVVFSLGGYDAVDTLSAAKLITISGAPEPLVRSRDILLGEVIRQLVPVGRGMRLRERLAEHTTAGAESVDAQARDVRWSLGWGFTVSAGELVDAARTAIDSFDPDFAISAVGAVKDPNHVWAARVERAWACYYRDEQLKASELP